MTRLLALLGDPVSHSLSPSMHNAALAHLSLDARYLGLRCDPEDLPGLLRGIARADGAGNVTVPHKASAAKAVEEPSETVRVTGSCNTFWLQEGRIHGDNTDVGGLMRALRSTVDGAPLGGATAVVLGAGGAARGAVAALSEVGVNEVRIRNRTRRRAEALVARPSLGGLKARIRMDPGALDDPLDPAVSIVVNATSLGMGDDDPLPLDPGQLPTGCRVVDLVYRPDETRFVREARRAGHPSTDGLEMLLQQGALAFERWWGRPAPLEVMRDALPSRAP